MMILICFSHQLEVADSVYITGIDIYETYHCGGVTAVKALRSPNTWQTLWRSAQPFDSNTSRIFSPPLMVGFVLFYSNSFVIKTLGHKKMNKVLKQCHFKKNYQN
jgi:hypothetical protein